MADEDKLTFPVVLQDIDCPTCGVKFGMPLEYSAILRKTYKEFYCPTGHPIRYPKPKTDPDAEKRYKNALTRIIGLKVNKVFNKEQLELAIEISENALKGP